MQGAQRNRRWYFWLLLGLGFFVFLASCSDNGKEVLRPTETTAPASTSEATTTTTAATETGGTDLVAAGEALFAKDCAACHTVGGGVLVGPDLAGVTTRRDTEFLKSWITDNVAFAEVNADAKALSEEFSAQMPPFALSDGDMDALLAYLESTAEMTTETTVASGPRELSAAEMEAASDIYFNRCAGCHGTLRAGATGPNIQPENTLEKGTEALETIITNGLPGGMPAWGASGVLSPEDIELMANFVQLPPPEPPQRPMADIRESWNLMVPVADRPTEPQTDRNWENYMGVVLRDAGKVTIIDGDTREELAELSVGFAAHIFRSSATGRYFIVVGRDGVVTLIDLWTETPTVVAQVQGCFDARSVESSKFEGFEDKYIVQGCYWPPQYIVYDGLTLEPLTVQSVLTDDIEGNPLDEVRVAAIIASHEDPVWILALKESGYVAVVDYSMDGFPIRDKIASAKFLHDGGWDSTQRYFMLAANAADKIVVIDMEELKLEAIVDVGKTPHPGRGANWVDPKFGPVWATVYLGEGKLTLIGTDPVNYPEYAWKVVRDVELPGTGSLF
ncbi:MAG TPA: c-type cytochrome, partial [Acidimicrobiales bacterium]|nr:c-type cytochrome [Acidimicrobiales bacterium]